jgi:membrane-bound lytic murein transglycosylase B
MRIIRNIIIIFLFLNNGQLFANDISFNDWLKNFKIYALKNDISESTFDNVMSDVVFLPNVIKYDRFQPEFYEDTKTYISKRSSNLKVKKGTELYKTNKTFIN